MPNGNNGKVLRVDLTQRKVRTDEPDARFYRTYMGGEGLVGYYLLQEQKAGVEPLGPENHLIFAPGVVTGAPLPGSGRHGVGARSPLTGGFAASEAGGFWGAELKHAGYDAIVVEGRADRPVYLWVHDGQAEIRDAAHLWGKTTGEAQEMIRAELGDRAIRVAQIGPGGENQVLYASIINDLKDSAGRGGMGAVMGSKNLKAIAVRGHHPPEMADREQVAALRRWFVDDWEAAGRPMFELGTAGGLSSFNETGNLPTFNFREGQFAGAGHISGEAMRDTILIDRDACFACPVRCKRVVRTEGRYQNDPAYGGPEYETLGALGSICGVDDLAAIAYGNQLCNAYSLDTISTGMSIGFAMECFEAGLLSEADTDGLRLTFGNAEAMVQMIERIARRQGLGDLLAQGVRRAAAAIGRGAEQYAMHVKGLELPMHEPRVKHGMGLGYAVSPIGADHMQGLHDTEYVSRAPTEVGILEPLPATDLSPAKVRLFVYRQTLYALLNSLLFCDFCDRYGLARLPEVVEAVTGWKTTAWELMKVGERALTLARAFNVREGLGRKDDRLPERFFSPHPTTEPKGVAVDREALARAVTTYYGMMGWDGDGVPTEARLHELGIGWAIGKMAEGAAATAGRP